MSNESLQELLTIFKRLTGTPSPEEEMEAHSHLMELLPDLINDCQKEEIKPLIKETLEIVKKWDTLDKWFKEVPNLSANMEKILKGLGVLTEEKKLEAKDLKPSTPEKESKGDDTSGLSDEMHQRLSKEIADAIAAATKNLPKGMDIGMIIKAVTEQVTKNFMQEHKEDPSKPKIMSPAIAASSIKDAPAKPAEKLGISKDDIVKSLMTTAQEKPAASDESATKSKLGPIKMSLPKVVQPMKKIVPTEEQSSNEKTADDILDENLFDEKPPQQLPQPKVQPQIIQPQAVKPQQPVVQPQQPVAKPQQQPTGGQQMVKLPQPKKISIPQPQKVEVKSQPQQPAAQPQGNAPQIIIKPVAGVEPAKNITIQKPVIQPVGGGPTIRPIAQPGGQPNVQPVIKPVSQQQPQIQAVSPRPFMVQGAGQGQPSVQPVNQFQPQGPKLNVQAQPVVQPIKVQPIGGPSSGVQVVKPINIPVQNSKNQLFDAFQQAAEQKNAITQVGGVKAVNISAPDNDGFSGAQKISGKEDFGFLEESETTKKMSKDQLYQELIALEGKKYAIEKNRKDMRTRHEKGQLPDLEYKTAIERLKYDLDHISEKINDIRQKIQSL